MDPITITAAAVAIAKATGLTEWIGRKLGGPPGERVSELIVSVAGEVVGGASTTEIVTRLVGNPEAEKALRAQLIDRETVLLKLNAADLADARSLYRAKSTEANRVSRSIMTWNLPAIVGLIGANCGAVYLIDNPAVAVAVGNVIGASISFLWQERQQVVGFFFGSSIGSKDKTDLMAAGKP
jgi:hypothetical protein